MAKKNWLMIKKGLSDDPKHREAMGVRVWLYMHMIDRADWETGRVFDWRDKDEADDMKMNWRTLQQQRQELEELGYINCKQDGNGQTITITNWTNPRNYSGEILNPKDKGTENYVPPEPKGTVEGTVASNSNLRTPSMRVRDQESLTRKPTRARTPLEIERSEIQTLFSKVTGIPEPNPKTERERKAAAARWYQPIRHIQEVCNGSSKRIVEEIVKQMRRDKVTIIAPQSIENMAIALYAEQKTETPSAIKYI